MYKRILWNSLAMQVKGQIQDFFIFLIHHNEGKAIFWVGWGCHFSQFLRE